MLEIIWLKALHNGKTSLVLLLPAHNLLRKLLLILNFVWLEYLHGQQNLRSCISYADNVLGNNILTFLQDLLVGIRWYSISCNLLTPGVH